MLYAMVSRRRMPWCSRLYTAPMTIDHDSDIVFPSLHRCLSWELWRHQILFAALMTIKQCHCVAVDHATMSWHLSLQLCMTLIMTMTIVFPSYTRLSQCLSRELWRHLFAALWHDIWSWEWHFVPVALMAIDPVTHCHCHECCEKTVTALMTDTRSC